MDITARATNVEAPTAVEVSLFEVFYRQEYRAVMGLVYALSGSRAAAEELTQDAFVAAYRRWSTVSGYADPGAWVRNVAMNNARSALRRRGAELRALARLGGRRVLPVGGLPRVHANDSQHITTTLVDPARTTVMLAVGAVDTPAPAFMPARMVDINGTAGWLSHRPNGVGGAPYAVVSWTPQAGIVATLASTTLIDDELLRVARSVAEVSDEEWSAIPRI